MFDQSPNGAPPGDPALMEAIVDSLLGAMGVFVLVVTFVGIAWRLFLREPLVAVVGVDWKRNSQPG